MSYSESGEVKSKRRRINDISETFLYIEQEQCEKLSDINFGERVAYIYNPLEYAKETHEDYIRKYCKGSKTVMFLGMNPGPFGMAQTGVPFGEVSYVKDWLKIEGNIGKPPKEHPQRIINGYDCKRSEVSGQRLWSFIQNIVGTPNTFFTNCFVHNYCPFVFMAPTGKNITPPELPVDVRSKMNEICDESLYKVMKLLEVKFIVGVGKFAEMRTKSVLKTYGAKDIQVFSIMHPSPVNPAANKGWKEIAYRQLQEMDILKYLKPCDSIS